MGSSVDCYECENKPPALDPDLQTLFECFCLCSGQLRSSFGSVYGLDYNVVIHVAKDFGIETNKTFYKLLKTFEDTLIVELNKNAERSISENSGQGSRG